MRRITISALGLAMLLASSLGGPRPAAASTIFLDGGAGCTGYGDSYVYSNVFTQARTIGCTYSNTYLYSTVYYHSGGSGHCGAGWLTNMDQVCRTYTWVDSVWSDHNLCYAWCSGYYQTYDYY
jgi:hypothetical protein